MMRLRRHSDRSVSPHSSKGRGFTLPELMIATVILLIVVVASSKIFGTASKITGLGEANADILQEAAAIEQQIRADFLRLNYQGFFAIQSNSVRNDVNVTGTGQMLDPNRAPSFQFRCDQLLFFTSGVQGTRNFVLNPNPGGGSSRKQQASAARVYYGHAFQLPEAPVTHDPIQDWAPWRAGTIQLEDRDPPNNTTTFEVPVFSPNQWLLSRQVVLLADDGGLETAYIGSSNSAFDIWDEDIRNGRVDIAASTVDDIRRAILSLGSWVNQSSQVNAPSIANAFFYPRAERVPPVETGDVDNPDFVRREDFALTTHVLGTACSRFIVEWTYRNRTAEFENLVTDNDPLTLESFRGVVIPPEHAQPWFGYRDPSDVSPIAPDNLELGADPARGIFRYQDWDSGGRGAWALNPFAIERPIFVGGGSGVVQYRAFFGFNRDEPRDLEDLDNDDDFLEFGAHVGFTPWPSAVRITMTLHDARNRLENGRTFQFIVSLPEREP